VQVLAVLIVVFGGLTACGGGVAGPVALQPGTPCGHCRMTVVDPKLASQLVGAGEEPRFFDDLGCLAAYLAAHPADPESRVYVADHASGEWLDARRALYGRDVALATPMNSHLFAHASTTARSADMTVHDTGILTPAVVFAPAALPGGTHDR
jgi:copper chaperone NosL